MEMFTEGEGHILNENTIVLILGRRRPTNVGGSSLQ